MKYLKTFESVDLENDLKDFCETYLAYLLDDDFELTVVWQGNDNFRIGRKDFYIINLIRLNDYGATGLKKIKRFNWLEVKDYFIPFIHILDKQYEIMDDTETYRRAGATDEPCISLYNGNQNFCVSIKDILSGDPLPTRYDEVPLLQISIRVEMKKITESVNLMKQDDIEHYLAYLIDEGFEVRSITEGGNFASINMMRKLSPTEWNSIYNCGLTSKLVILGTGNNPLKVFDTPRNGHRVEKLLSNYNCGLLTQVDERAHEAADRLLHDFTGFSTTKIIISFKVEQGTLINMSIRLQIILIE